MICVWVQRDAELGLGENRVDPICERPLIPPGETPAMRLLFTATSMLASCFVFTSAVAGNVAPANQAANRLVALVKPHEREAQAIHFMFAVSPLEMPAGL